MFSKVKFYTINFKKNFLSILLCLFIICLLVFSKSNISAAKNGLSLWVNSVVPSLFPFFIAIELLNHTNVAHILGKLLNRFMKPIFNVPGIGAYIFIMGIISGYPTGAKIVTQFRENGMITKAEGERLLTFTNNSGALFILGTVGITLFGNSTIGILLLLTHILACISVGIVFRFWKLNDTEKINSNNLNKNLKANSSNILGSSISSSINTILMIGGFIVLFSIIISILNTSKVLLILSNIFIPIMNFFNIDNKFCVPIISGILELTNGISLVAGLPNKLLSTNIIISAFLLGFGGISVVLQIYAIIADTDISIIPYILGKFLQGIFASFYTFVFINIFPFFNFDLVSVFSYDVNNLKYSNFYNYSSITAIVFLCLVFIVLATKYIGNFKLKNLLKN